MEKPFIIHLHCDLAWNMQAYRRDYTRSAAETRQLEKDTNIPENNGDSLIGWPDYQRGRVAIVFSTLFASPLSGKLGDWDKTVYADYEEAHRVYLGQLRLYHQLTDSKPDYFRLILNTKDLRNHMNDWGSPEKRTSPSD